MTLRVIPGGVAGATVVRFVFFASVVTYPAVTHFQLFIPEVVLGCGIRIAGDDVSIMVDEACLPVITTDYIADVIPGISFGDINKLSVRVFGRLAVDNLIQFIRVSALIKDIIGELV